MKNILTMLAFAAFVCSCASGCGPIDLGTDVAAISCVSAEGVYPRLVVSLNAKPPCPELGPSANAQYFPSPLPDGGVLCDANGCYFQGFSLVCTCAVVHEGWE
jgi:hypothetical protein